MAVSSNSNPSLSNASQSKTLKTSKFKVFAHTAWDIVPVLCGIGHLAFVIGMFLVFDEVPWWVNGILGCIYAISISWNINGVSHNFIHNPYFVSPFLNRAFSLVESLAIGFSQVFYDYVHMRHHVGNSDRQDEKGETIDWLSIYKFGKNDQPENVWAYTFLSYFRDDPKDIYAEIKKRSEADAQWGRIEIIAYVSFIVLGFILNWQFMLFLIPFNYLGNCLSSLNGFYEHFGGNTELPIAWGVSNYGWLYNVIWFNNGYHAEHHFRPKMHWTQMKAFHEKIAEDQRKAGVHVISHAHALGFLESVFPIRPLSQLFTKQARA
jgi:fatty acid desaturase